MRLDLALAEKWVTPGSHVLDLACGELEGYFGRAGVGRRN